MKKLLPACLVFFLVACGGGSSGDAVLHFTGRDETEANYRERVRDLKKQSPNDFIQACSVIEKMTPAQAQVALRDDSPDDGTIPAGSTKVAGQVADTKSLIRSAEIVQDECKR